MFWPSNWKLDKTRLLSWLIPDSHRGRILLIMLLGLLMTQLASYWAWRHQAQSGQFDLVDKVSSNVAYSVASTVKFFTGLPRQYRHMVLDQLRKMGGTRFYVSLNRERIRIHEVGLDPQKKRVVDNFRAVLGSELTYQQLWVQFSEPETLHVHTNDTLLTEIPERWSQRLLIDNLSPPILVIQLQLAEGEWLYVATLLPVPDFLANMRLMSPQTLAYLLVFLAGVIGLSFLVIRQQTRPLTFMLRAAEELGQDIGHEPIPETGSREIRATARVFNQMQARIQTYLSDREHFFTAMSHDLKTPITRMRIRTELLDKPQHRTKFARDLDEVEQMVRGALQALRDTHYEEDALATDLSQLIEDVIEDVAGQDHPISLNGSAAPLKVKPLLLKRALTNLMENAIFYGERCDIRLTEREEIVNIEIRDYGPGIPEAERERVFKPFVRLEPSRSRNTGGSGLGLGIARNIMHAHGGELHLDNHNDGGLVVNLLLPRKNQ